MKTILLDDEHLALEYLEHQLGQIPNIQIVGKYTSPTQGKEAVLATEVDVVFLDIQMPEMSGIELAEQIIEQKPQVHVVFVTAYDEYAVQAFELNVLDYVLKPISRERLEKTVERVRRNLLQETPVPQSSEEAGGDTLMRVQFFDHFAMYIDDELLTLRWRTMKAQELFLYMLQSRGRLVRKSTLIDVMWPEYEPDKAYSLLYTSIYHIRKTLSASTVNEHLQIKSESDGYILVRHKMVTDAEQVEQLLHGNMELNEHTLGRYEKIVALYQGDYLQDFDYWWLESERHRLKMLWLRAAMGVAEWYEHSANADRALKWYLDICERYPLAEEAHFAVMKIYAAQDNHLSVHKQYRLLEAVIMEELYERPSPYINEWYESWKAQHET